MQFTRQITVDKFLSEYWGKKPLIAKRTSTSLSYCGDNFLSLSKVHEACQNHSLTQPSDYITCKYVNGKRQNCNFDHKILMNQATGKNVSIAPQIDAAVKNIGVRVEVQGWFKGAAKHRIQTRN